jgi:signal transduction histidine kinase
MNATAEDLQRMNRVLRHRLRNFASGIRSAVTILEGELDGQLDAESQEYFPLIAHECDVITEMTQHLNLLLDPECDERQTGTTPEPLGDLLALLADRISSVFTTSTFDVDMDQTLAVVPVPCGGHVRASLFEIVKNAIEEMGHAPVKLTASVEHDAVVFAVADRGTGLRDATPDEIFKPFFTTRTKHLGIGLTIASELIGEAHGSIVAMVPEGGGLLVTMRIPLAGRGTEMDRMLGANPTGEHNDRT